MTTEASCLDVSQARVEGSLYMTDSFLVHDKVALEQNLHIAYNLTMGITTLCMLQLNAGQDKLRHRIC